MDGEPFGNRNRQGKMKHKVNIYDIEHDKMTIREFGSRMQAEDYALALKRFFLNRPNPAPIFIEVI